MKLFSAGSTISSERTSPSVITFSVQLGTPGYGIARMVAAQLGYRYCDSQITSQAGATPGILQELLAGDAQDTLIERMVRRLSAATVYEEEVPAGLVGPEPAALESALKRLAAPEYRRLIEGVVREIAHRGE